MVFNLILRTCIFPYLWKISRISLLYKKGSRNEITNHRPIAILCHFSKVFEVLIHTFVSGHLKNIIVPEQHGFIEGRSAVTNFICNTQFINAVLDRRGQVDNYSGFSKAFDRLDQGLLLSKLENILGSCLTAMFRSYLACRTQFVHSMATDSFAQTTGSSPGFDFGAP